MRRPAKSLVQAYLRMIADRMGCKDWEITLGEDVVAEDDAYAVVETYPGHRAVVTLCASFSELPARRQRHYLVHEICHLHTHRLRQIAEDLLAGAGAVGASVELMIEDADEHAVEVFAKLLEDQLPLPRFS